MRSADRKSVRPSRLHVNGGRRTVCRVLPNAAHQSILSRRTSVVSPKLSRSYLVQAGLSEVDCAKPLIFLLRDRCVGEGTVYHSAVPQRLALQCLE
jgi:hypothetical protein